MRLKLLISFTIYISLWILNKQILLCYVLQDQCVGLFFSKVFITKMKIGAKDGPAPGFLVPRVW